jgi:hypothetical protein
LATLGIAAILVSIERRGAFRGGYTVTRDFLCQTNIVVLLLFSVFPSLYGLWILRKTKRAEEPSGSVLK